MWLYVNKTNCNFTKKDCYFSVKRVKQKNFVGVTKKQNLVSKTSMIAMMIGRTTDAAAFYPKYYEHKASKFCIKDTQSQ